MAGQEVSEATNDGSAAEEAELRQLIMTRVST